MVNLVTVPNESRCAFTEEEHILAIKGCCPVSGNPLVGSELTILYKPEARILEVAALRAYLDSYIGGRGQVRSMEGMVQAIAQDAADILGVQCTVTAELLLAPEQRMRLKCYAFPK